MGNGSCKENTQVKTSIKNSRKPKSFDDDTSNADRKSMQSSYSSSVMSKQEAPSDDSNDKESDDTSDQMLLDSKIGEGTLQPHTGEQASQSKNSQQTKSADKPPDMSGYQKSPEGLNEKADQLPENDGNAMPHSPNAYNRGAIIDQSRPLNGKPPVDQSKGKSYCKECDHCKKTKDDYWIRDTPPSPTHNVIPVKKFDIIKTKNSQNHMANGLGQPLHYTRLPMILKPGSKSSPTHTPYPNYDELQSRSHRLYLNGGVLSTN